MATIIESLAREATLVEVVVALEHAGQSTAVVAGLMTRRCLAVYSSPSGGMFICQRHAHPEDEAHVPHETEMWWIDGPLHGRCSSYPEGTMLATMKHTRCHRRLGHEDPCDHVEVHD